MAQTNPHPPTLWIIGGGKFGLISAQALRKKHPAARIVVVDQDQAVCSGMEKRSFQSVCMDGISFLNRSLTDPAFPDWIVPVVPVHLTYEWVKARLTAAYTIDPIPVPDSVLMQIPNVMHGSGPQVYSSIADFLCPEDCPEPSGNCTHTGKLRPCLLYEQLERLTNGEIPSIVVKSRKLAPGVGGFRPAALFTALEAVSAATGPVLLSTACSCHGVINAFEIRPR